MNYFCIKHNNFNSLSELEQQFREEYLNPFLETGEFPELPEDYAEFVQDLRDAEIFEELKGNLINLNKSIIRVVAILTIFSFTFVFFRFCIRLVELVELGEFN